DGQLLLSVPEVGGKLIRQFAGGGPAEPLLGGLHVGRRLLRFLDRAEIGAGLPQARLDPLQAVGRHTEESLGAFTNLGSPVAERRQNGPACCDRRGAQRDPSPPDEEKQDGRKTPQESRRATQRRCLSQ